MIRSIVPMNDGSELLLIGLTAEDVALFQAGAGVRYSPTDLRKAGMKSSNISVAMVYEETMTELIDAIRRTGVTTETIFETRHGDLHDPDC